MSLHLIIMFWKTFFLLLTYKPQPLQLPSRKKYSDSIQLSTFVVFFFSIHLFTSLDIVGKILLSVAVEPASNRVCFQGWWLMDEDCSWNTEKSYLDLQCKTWAYKVTMITIKAAAEIDSLVPSYYQLPLPALLWLLHYQMSTFYRMLGKHE